MPIRESNYRFKQIIIIIINCLFISAPLYAKNTCTGQSPAPRTEKQQSPIKILSGKTTKDSAYLPDYSFAGYKNSNTPPPDDLGTIISVNTYGAFSDDSKDDTEAISKALVMANKTEGLVTVFFPEGRYIITDILFIERSNIRLLGNNISNRKTEFYFPIPLSLAKTAEKMPVFKKLSQYIADGKKTEPHEGKNISYSPFSWTGGFIWIREPKVTHEHITSNTRGERGELNVVTKDARRLVAGDIIEIRWSNDRGKNGPLIKELYGDTKISIGEKHWAKKSQALVKQRLRVNAINEDSITVAGPLLHTISSALPAEIFKLSSLENIGIDNIDLSFPESENMPHHVEKGYNGIQVENVFDMWIRNMTITNADNGILTNDSANITVENTVSKGSHRSHYAVHIGRVHNMLVKNLTIYNEVIHPATVNHRATKCVLTNLKLFSNPILDQHSGANHQNLFDNILMHIEPGSFLNKKGETRYSYRLWKGGGPDDFRPRHGRYNTFWNLRVHVANEETKGSFLLLKSSKEEGPGANIIGLNANGNRKLKVRYTPAPYLERENVPMSDIPSLYNFQLDKRIHGK